VLSSSRSASGVFDLAGNGWEWTSTAFAPFPGFEPFPFYPGYSADFFTGRHFVLKGASPRTEAALVRPSFRNWFQAHYPNVYATFRCVEN
jgi:formylglycine-generating enzyme required for sulfatase activity